MVYFQKSSLVKYYKKCSLAPNRHRRRQMASYKRNLNNLEVFLLSMIPAMIDIRSHLQSGQVWYVQGFTLQIFKFTQIKKSYKHLILNDSIVSKTYCVHTEKINSIFPKNSQMLKFEHFITGDKSDGVMFGVTKDFVTRKW